MTVQLKAMKEDKFLVFELPLHSDGHEDCLATERAVEYDVIGTSRLHLTIRLLFSYHTKEVANYKTVAPTLFSSYTHLYLHYFSPTFGSAKEPLPGLPMLNQATGSVT